MTAAAGAALTSSCWLLDHRAARAAMRAALANGDTQALTSAAHTLRGASSMLDADEVVAACLQLEAGEVAADRQQRVVDGLDRQLAAMRELVRAF